MGESVRAIRKGTKTALRLNRKSSHFVGHGAASEHTLHRTGGDQREILLVPSAFHCSFSLARCFRPPSR